MSFTKLAFEDERERESERIGETPVNIAALMDGKNGRRLNVVSIKINLKSQQFIQFLSHATLKISSISTINENILFYFPSYFNLVLANKLGIIF